MTRIKYVSKDDVYQGWGLPAPTGGRLPVCGQAFGLQGLAKQTVLMDSNHFDNMRQSCRGKKSQ